MRKVSKMNYLNLMENFKPIDYSEGIIIYWIDEKSFFLSYILIILIMISGCFKPIYYDLDKLQKEVGYADIVNYKY